MDNEKTGMLIKTLRIEKGITQKELAEKIQVSNATVSKWENAHGFPDISLLEPLAEALDISITELISGERSLTAPAKEETAIIRDIIHLSEFEQKRRLARDSIITGLLVLLILISGYSGITYLWYYQNEPLPIPNGLLALFPLSLGLLAWILPIINIVRRKKKESDCFGILSSISFLLCAIAIWIPILTMDLLMRNHQSGTVQDLVWGYNFASMFLLMVTLTLNLLAYHTYKKKF